MSLSKLCNEQGQVALAQELIQDAERYWAQVTSKRIEEEFDIEPQIAVRIKDNWTTSIRFQLDNINNPLDNTTYDQLFIQELSKQLEETHDIYEIIMLSLTLTSHCMKLNMFPLAKEYITTAQQYLDQLDIEYMMNKFEVDYETATAMIEKISKGIKLTLSEINKKL